MAKNDCFVYYIIATMLDGTKKVHSFPHLIGTKCSYKYVNMKGEGLDLSKYNDRTLHPESSLDSTLGNIIHETREKKYQSECCMSTCATHIRENSKITDPDTCIKNCCIPENCDAQFCSTCFVAHC